jgi:hypothetical protein
MPWLIASINPERETIDQVFASTMKFALAFDLVLCIGAADAGLRSSADRIRSIQNGQADTVELVSILQEEEQEQASVFELMKVFEASTTGMSMAPTNAPSVSSKLSSAPSFPGSFVLETVSPTVSVAPSVSPTVAPTVSVAPGVSPTTVPASSVAPTDVPTDGPSLSVTPTTNVPTEDQSLSVAPANVPTDGPSISVAPTTAPTDGPSISVAPTTAPTDGPSISVAPTTAPTDGPFMSVAPTTAPTDGPSISVAPTTAPTDGPSMSVAPTTAPTDGPSMSIAPTDAPTALTGAPSNTPTLSVCGITANERETAIMEMLDQIADSALIRDSSTPQGLATDWIIAGDPRRVCPDEPKLVQRWALAVMYFSTGGDDWTECFAGDLDCTTSLTFLGEDPFLSASNECQWAGIACDFDACVTEIEFEDNNLAGTIPTELGLFGDLVRVYNELLPFSGYSLTFLFSVRSSFGGWRMETLLVLFHLKSVAWAILFLLTWTSTR